MGQWNYEPSRPEIKAMVDMVARAAAEEDSGFQVCKLTETLATSREARLTLAYIMFQRGKGD